MRVGFSIVVAQALMLSQATACEILRLEHVNVPSFLDVESSVYGAGFPHENGSITLVERTNTTVEHVVETETVTNGTQLMFRIPANTLTAGELYEVVVKDEHGVELCRTYQVTGLYAHGTIAVNEHLRRRKTGDASPVSNPRMNAAGKDKMILFASNLFPAQEQQVVVLFQIQNLQMEWSAQVSGEVILFQDSLAVEVLTPPIRTPDSWLLSCDDKRNPVKSGDCIPDVTVQVSISLDQGLSFSDTKNVVFQYERPLRVAFLFKAEVNDFGWNAQINDARVQLEAVYGNAADMSTYFEHVAEGHSAPHQENRGKTFETDTPVPEFVEVDGQTVKNIYFEAINIMKRLCDEDYDLIVPTTFGFSRQVWDMEGYEGCKKVGDGSDPNAAERYTFFAGTGTSGTNPQYSRAYSKTYQSRYLAGMTSGFELRRQTVESQIDGTYDANEKPCVGFIAPFPGAVDYQLNAFAAGCTEVFPECVIKTMFIGTFFNPDLERDASAFFWNVEKCSIIVQHTDSIAPQIYYRDVKGYSIGYNGDQRSLLGDSVLTSELMVWKPMIKHFMDQIFESMWIPAERDPSEGGSKSLQEDLFFGFGEGAVDMAEFFSPRIDPYAQEHIRRKKRELEQAKGDDAYDHIFCGPILKRWVMPQEDPDTPSPRRRGCGGQSEYIRLDTPEELDSRMYWNKDHEILPSGQTVGPTDCMHPDAVRGGSFPRTYVEEEVYNDYFLNGIEIVQAKETPFGKVFGSVLDVPEEECPTSRTGPVGLGYYEAPLSYPPCDGSQWEIYRASCNPATMMSAVHYRWKRDNFTNAELICGNEIDIAGKYSSIAQLPILEDAIICDYVVAGSTAATFGIVATVIGIVFNLGIILLLFKYRNNKAVRSTQPILVMVMALGGVFLCASNLTFLGEHTQRSCALRVFLFNIAFDSVFAVLWAKIYRIFKLFNGVKKLKRVVIKNRDMLFAAGALMSIDVLILTIWLIVDPPLPAVEKNVAVPDLPAMAVNRIPYTTCQSSSNVFSLMVIFYKVMLIASACFLVFSSKNVPSSYVEHKFIIFSAYNTAIFSGVVLLLTGADNPATAFMIHSVGTVAGTMIINGSLALPRALLAMNVWVVPSTTHVSGVTSGASTSKQMEGNTTTSLPSTSQK